MSEIKLKTHLIITDIHNEYDINWCGKLQGADPVIKDGKPIFIIQAAGVWMELNTWDIKHLEDVCKKLTRPRGREAVTKDQARIYLKENGGKRRCMGTVTHRRVKTFAPMYDRVEWR